MMIFEHNLKKTSTFLGVDKPCLNNGVCTNLINGYRCLCPNGYNGTRCEINENECDPNPCVNGFCIDGIAQYKCKCNPGWEGHNCEININECLNHSCVNGYCIDGINSYSCVCQAGRCISISSRKFRLKNH